jgi:ATP-dependent Clp protease ATP-binding subunit ClpA
MDLKEFLQKFATPALVESIRGAMLRADQTARQTYLAHLVDTVLDDESVKKRINEDVRLKARAALAEQMVAFPKVSAEQAATFAFDLNSLTTPAIALARDWGAEKVSPLTLLATCLSPQLLKENESARTQEALRTAGLTVEALVPQRGAKDSAMRADFTFKSLGFGSDITAMARAGVWTASPLIGMEQELKRLTTLMSSAADSVVLVGEPGVGKSAIVQGLAYHIAHGTRPLIPPEMDSWTIVMISPVNMLAGTGGRGELEGRLDKLLAFFRKNPTVIPFFDEIHTLLDTDDPSARTIATTLKPPMASGLFRCIGATTDKEYARFIASDEAMNSRFTKLLLPEPDVETSTKIIEGAIGNLTPARARELGITMPHEVIRAAVKLTAVYQRSDRLPRKAIRLVRNVFTEKTYAVQTSTSPMSREITSADVAKTFSGLSGIPVDDLDEERADFYVRLREKLSGHVKGQGQAIDGVTSWLSLHSSGWVDSRRPRGRFLFLGPPGVGKTELALRLAEEVMRDRGSLIVKNMAEFKGEGARTKFMGADPGYVGFGQTSTIYSRIMMRPYSVVVLDEFEKAHPELSDPLISVLDGQAEDAQGRFVDFSQCVFVMTSNALTRELDEGAGEEGLRRALLKMGGIWSPPLVDRIDRIVLFNPLDEGALFQILGALIEARRKVANKPLPKEIDEDETRQQILAWATEGGHAASARRLERALLRWLMERASAG